MRRKFVVLILAAALAVAAFASTAQAHWASRQVFSNGQWWAIHYDLQSDANLGYTDRIEVFSSCGGLFAVPYTFQVIDVARNIVYGTWSGVQAGTHYITGRFAPTYAQGVRIRVLTPNIGPLVTSCYYAREYETVR